MQTSTSDQIRAAVRRAYGAVATQKQQSGCCGGGTSCCGPTGSSSTQLGYTDADLAAVPEGADWGWAAAILRQSLASDLASVSSTSGVAPDSMPFSPLNKSARPDMSLVWT